MRITINTIDSLFFRNGRPFDLGDESWAEGIFPPPPSTFKGMLLGAYMAQKGLSPVEAFAFSKSLIIKGVYLKIDGKYYFPTPADLIDFETDNSGNKKDHEAHFLSMESAPPMSNCKTPFVLKTNSNKKVREINGKTIISDQVLGKYLKGSEESLNYYPTKDIICKEPKVGIGRDFSQRITKEGQLYRVDMVRPVVGSNPKSVGIPGSNGESVELVVDGNLPEDFAESGIMRFGAEGKTISFLSQTEESILQLPKIKGSTLKIYLATAAIFEAGWAPHWLLPQGNEKKAIYKLADAKSLEIELLTCAIGRTQYYGGFDVQLGMPKPMYRAVPAGSVYYLKLKSTEDAQLLAKELHGKCISELDKSKDGYGLCFIANMPEI